MPLSSDIKDRVERERIAHEDDDVLRENVKIKDRFHHIYTYPSRIRLYESMDINMRKASGQRILDYGCGWGDASLKYLSWGCHVTGIDISEPYIKEAEERCLAAGYTRDQFRFAVMDAHNLEFEDSTFDIVVGYGILHHLDADVAMSEIHRVLKPGGRVMLQEPLADNPLLKIFRLLTPKARTEDEEPFSGQQVAALASSDKWDTDLVYCGIVSLPVAMLTSKLIPSRPDNWLIRWSDGVERFLHRHGILNSMNQYVVFNMTKRG